EGPEHRIGLVLRGASNVLGVPLKGVFHWPVLANPGVYIFRRATPNTGAGGWPRRLWLGRAPDRGRTGSESGTARGDRASGKSTYLGNCLLDDAAVQRAAAQNLLSDLTPYARIWDTNSRFQASIEVT